MAKVVIENRGGCASTGQAEAGRRICAGVHGNRAPEPFTLRAGQLLQRAHPKASRLGIRWRVCR